MKPEKLHIIDTVEGLEDLINKIPKDEYIAFDTETTGVSKSSLIIGISLAWTTEEGYYVILRRWCATSGSLLDLDTNARVHPLLTTLVSHKLIMHNAPFDCWMVKTNFGVELMGAVHTDTLALGHLLDENRSNGLKERAIALYGEDAAQEQAEMKASVLANGGMLTKQNYELYKADPYLIAKYGAKDAILTLKLFYNDVPQLYEEGLDEFFYELETMPLLRGPTYELNTTGLKVDLDKLASLQRQLEVDCLEAKSLIYKDIHAYVKDKYPGTSRSNTFNINAPQQLAWLVFHILGADFYALTKSGKELCKALDIKIPYAPADKRRFVKTLEELYGRVYAPAQYNKKTKKLGRPKKVGHPWQYMSCGKESIGKIASKYRWAELLLKYKKDEKLLSTYVGAIRDRTQYGIIRPSFLQHGTTSGRYSSKNPNFQNLPRDDKRVKGCIFSRPGHSFVGADYAQLEPRVFAAVSKDTTLCRGFAENLDFYSVVGCPIFGVAASLKKDDPNSFAKKYPQLRDKAKVIALATPYGRTAAQQAATMGISKDESQQLIDSYFEKYPLVEAMMLESHEQVKDNGVVYSLFGRPRRIPEAKNIRKIYGNASHSQLPYEVRNLLNLAMNHRVQGTAANIVNRASIAFYNEAKRRGWDAKIVLQVHDELVVECPDEIASEVAKVLKDCMEKTTTLLGVELLAEPKIAKNLADLK